MEMASCTRAFLGSCTSPPCRRSVSASSCKADSCLAASSSRPLPSLQVSANPRSSSSTFNPLFCCAVERNPSSSSRSTAPSCPSILCSLQMSANRLASSRRSISVCYAIEGNSTSSSGSTTADAEPPSFNKEQGADSGEASPEVEEQESLGKALSQMRQERVVSGEENPSKTEEFWRGVLEETRLIEWPSIQKVLGTTGVVTGIIVGASLVLLTVNALLAQLSDAFFKNAPPAPPV